MSTIWKNGKYQPLIKYVTLKDFKKLSNAIDIINGDSDTKGSIKKAIKDLVGEAPEAYDTLKEIADKLKSDDDLHKALNDAIILKASSDALNKEITRAKQAEATIDEKLTNKADTTALNNYVLTTALNEQVNALNTAIGAKQDAGNYLPYEGYGNFIYKLQEGYKVQFKTINSTGVPTTLISGSNIQIKQGEKEMKYSFNGITSNQYNNCLATSDGTFKPISDFALKTELPTVPTKVSELQNDSEFIAKSVYDEKIAALEARIAALEAKHTETNTQIET